MPADGSRFISKLHESIAYPPPSNAPIAGVELSPASDDFESELVGGEILLRPTSKLKAEEAERALANNPFLRDSGYAKALLKVGTESQSEEMRKQWIATVQSLPSRIKKLEDESLKLQAGLRANLGSLQQVALRAEQNKLTLDSKTRTQLSEAIVEMEGRIRGLESDLQSKILKEKHEAARAEGLLRESGISVESPVEKRSASDHEKEMSRKELERMSKNLERIYDDYMAYINPLIRVVENSIGSTLYFGILKPEWFRLGYDFSGKLDQGKIDKVLSSINAASREANRLLTGRRTKDVGLDELQQRREGIIDGTKFSPDGTRRAVFSDRKVIATLLIEDYKNIGKKLANLKLVIDYRLQQLKMDTGEK